MVGNVRTDGSLFVISLQAKMCSDALLTCLPTVDIFTDLKFSRSDIHGKYTPRRVKRWLMVHKYNIYYRLLTLTDAFRGDEEIYITEGYKLSVYFGIF